MRKQVVAFALLMSLASGAKALAAPSGYSRNVTTEWQKDSLRDRDGKYDSDYEYLHKEELKKLETRQRREKRELAEKQRREREKIENSDSSRKKKTAALKKLERRHTEETKELERKHQQERKALADRQQREIEKHRKRSN